MGDRTHKEKHQGHTQKVLQARAGESDEAVQAFSYGASART